MTEVDNTNLKYFLAAKEAAKMSTFHKCHTGCVIVYKNRIISSGFNSSKTHPLQKEYNKERYDSDSTPHYMHAEVHALANLINDTNMEWKKIHLYTYRIKGNKYGLSRPCHSCLKLIKHLGIRNIHYTTDDGYCYEYLDVGIAILKN